MKDITELTVTELRLFRPDVVPLRTLITASNLHVFSSPYIFKNVNIVEDEDKNITALQMKLGEFKVKNKIYPIEVLIIEWNRILFRIKANSDIAGQFYQKITQSLSELDPYGQFKKNKPLITTMNTSCVVTLDLSYRDFFSRKMNTFVNNDAVNACSSVLGGVATVQILPKSLAFNVSYLVKEASLLNSNVTINPKLIVIEPRLETDPKDRRFFTSSPTDSKTHLSLLTKLEKYFKKSK